MYVCVCVYIYIYIYTAHLLRSWVRIPPGEWIFVCCECRVLSGRGLCDELITCPEESYRLWCVVVCDLENLKNEEAMTRVGLQRHRKKKVLIINWMNKVSFAITDIFSRNTSSHRTAAWGPAGHSLSNTDLEGSLKAQHRSSLLCISAPTIRNHVTFPPTTHRKTSAGNKKYSNFKATSLSIHCTFSLSENLRSDVTNICLDNGENRKLRIADTIK